jgi:hypothetical protein
MSIISTFAAGINRRHAEQDARGEHDDECEWRAAGFWLCHCSKRRREAAGRTEPPVMIFESPTCSGCDRAAEHTGDGWACPRCHVYFGDLYDEPGNWEDDYGPDLAADLAKWEAAQRTRS